LGRSLLIGRAHFLGSFDQQQAVAVSAIDSSLAILFASGSILYLLSIRSWVSGQSTSVAGEEFQ
jgi:hypothetical protein